MYMYIGDSSYVALLSVFNVPFIPSLTVHCSDIHYPCWSLCVYTFRFLCAVPHASYVGCSQFVMISFRSSIPGYNSVKDIALHEIGELYTYSYTGSEHECTHEASRERTRARG